ncbi:MAG: hypothetical protein NC342_01285, partial [Pseudoflavonifractor sp.]|nr:hypothetical protein [Pseudoflavonifractor sp.]
VVAAMTAAGDADSAAVRALMEKYPGPTDDAAERHIRRLPAWPRIAANYLAKDRRVTYDYTWTLRSFTTDGELLEMYRVRPDAFSEAELLQVGHLMAPDTAAMAGVYRYTLSRFPASEAAANNLAAILIGAGEYAEALTLLDGLTVPEAIHNREMLMAIPERYFRKEAAR